MSEALYVIRTAWKHASVRNAPLLAAGVAFYAFLSIFPAMIAGVLSYGLMASPENVQAQSDRISDALPADAASVITGQLDALTRTGNQSLSLGLVLAVAVALYSASSGAANLLVALRVMFGRNERPSFVTAKLEALGLTGAALLFAIALVALVAAAPAVLDALEVSPWVRVAAEFGRWMLVAAALTVSIAVLFRRAEGAGRRPMRLGVGVAVGLWISASVGFSVYVDNFGSYGRTYGALAGVVALLLWLWVGLYALLLGASVQAVIAGASEHASDEERDRTDNHD